MGNVTTSQTTCIDSLKSLVNYIEVVNEFNRKRNCLIKRFNESVMNEEQIQLFLSVIEYHRKVVSYYIY